MSTASALAGAIRSVAVLRLRDVATADRVAAGLAVSRSDVERMTTAPVWELGLAVRVADLLGITIAVDQRRQLGHDPGLAI